MLRLILGTIAFVCATGTFASAQWITDTRGGAFDDKPLRIAMTAKGKYALGLRCRDSQSMELVYITSEDADESIQTMNVMSPKLRLRADKGEIIDLPGRVENIDGKLVFTSDAGANIFELVRDAKSSVAVVLTVLEQNFHENSFGVQGSKAAINKISSGCEVTPQ